MKKIILLLTLFSISLTINSQNCSNLAKEANKLYKKGEIEQCLKKLELILASDKTDKSTLEYKIYAGNLSFEIYRMQDQLDFKKKAYQLGISTLTLIKQLAPLGSDYLNENRTLISDIKKGLAELLHENPNLNQQIVEPKKEFAIVDKPTGKTNVEKNTPAVNETIPQTNTEKTVTITVSGSGKTPDEAKQSALRSAIEQAFGAFISSKTEILNDNLVKNEIVSISNGNIQKFEVISEVQIPNGDYAICLKATVSITKLTSFVESKGILVEFKGSLFGANIKQQKLNKDSEYKAILNLCFVSRDILKKSLDFEISTSEPIIYNEDNSINSNPVKYLLEFNVKCRINKNYGIFYNYFKDNISKISMSENEILDYNKLNATIYKIQVENKTYYLRELSSIIAIQNLFVKANQLLLDFKVISNVDTTVIKDCCYDYRSNNTKEKSNNIYRYNYYGPDIWNLNISNQSENRRKFDNSDNPNPGFPDVQFGNDSKYVSSWSVFYNYIYWLTNHDAIFNESTYFTTSSQLLKLNGKSTHDYFPEPPMGDIPGGNFSIIFNSFSREYSHKIKKLYSLADIERITKFQVVKLN